MVAHAVPRSAAALTRGFQIRLRQRAFATIARRRTLRLRPLSPCPPQTSCHDRRLCSVPACVVQTEGFFCLFGTSVMPVRCALRQAGAGRGVSGLFGTSVCQFCGGASIRGMGGGRDGRGEVWCRKPNKITAREEESQRSLLAMPYPPALFAVGVATEEDFPPREGARYALQPKPTQEDVPFREKESKPGGVHTTLYNQMQRSTLQNAGRRPFS